MCIRDRGGIVYADAITTVSNTYAEEIKMPFYGEGLDGLMRARAGNLRGIVNGIDYEEFNPETDPQMCIRDRISANSASQPARGVGVEITCDVITSV